MEHAMKNLPELQAGGFEGELEALEAGSTADWLSQAIYWLPAWSCVLDASFP